MMTDERELAENTTTSENISGIAVDCVSQSGDDSSTDILSESEHTSAIESDKNHSYSSVEDSVISSNELLKESTELQSGETTSDSWGSEELQSEETTSNSWGGEASTSGFNSPDNTNSTEEYLGTESTNSWLSDTTIESPETIAGVHNVQPRSYHYHPTVKSYIGSFTPLKCSSTWDETTSSGSRSWDTVEESRQDSRENLDRRNSNSNVGRNNIIVGGLKIIDKSTPLCVPFENDCYTCSTMIQKYCNSYLDFYCEKKDELLFDTSVLDLPDTTLLKIFSYLTEEQVCTAACVCQEWKRVAYDSSLWNSVDLRRFHTSLDEYSLTKLVRSRMTPLLYKINLGGLSLTARVFKILANECPKLKIMSLESVTFLEKFSSKQKNFPLGLETLDLRHCSGDTSAFCAIARALDGIESLGVSDQFLTSLLCTNELEPLFSRLSQAKVLEFSYCSSLTDVMMGYVAMHCPLLESLCLRRCNTFHGASLPLLLTSCPRITSLVLDGTAIADGSLRAPDWSKTKITELDLSWCRHLSQEGLKSALFRLTKLRYLRLCCVGYGHGVTNEVMDAMALAKYEDLKILDASYSSLLTDDALSDFIDVCPGLLYLRINHCRSTTPRLMELLPADSQVFVVANFPIDSDVQFNRDKLRYTYWPTPIFMRNFGLDIQMGWK